MSCEVCEVIKNRLESELGNRITRRMIEDMFGITLRVIKACEVCGQGYYAKGKCYNHYMADRRSKGSNRVNELGQHIGRDGNPLCDAKGCDYDMVRRDKGLDGKWYCAHHLNEVNKAFRAIETELQNFDTTKGKK